MSVYAVNAPVGQDNVVMVLVVMMVLVVIMVIIVIMVVMVVVVVFWLLNEHQIPGTWD